MKSKLWIASMLSAFGLGSGVTWTIPSAPTLVSPADSAKDVAYHPTVTWNKVPDAKKYLVQIALDTAFAKIEVQDSARTDTVYRSPNPLSYGKTFYWRVKSGDDTSWGDFSPVRSLTTVTSAPATPVPVAPAAGAVDVAWPIVFKWTKSALADYYQLQVSSDSAFSDTLLTVRPKDTTYFTVNLPLGKYWWRVHARSDVYGISKYTTAISFTTVIGPAAPTLVSPIDSAIDVSDRPVFFWNKTDSAIAYRIEISIDSTFKKIFQYDSLKAPEDTTVRKGLLANLKVYYWRVRGWSAGGPGPWSAIRRFTTMKMTKPTKPTPLSPTNDSTVSANPVLSWKKADRAMTYRLQVSTAYGFDSTVFDDSTLTALSKTVGPLDPGVVYYWRVMASNDSGISSWSTPWQFTIEGGDAVKSNIHGASAAFHFAVSSPGADASARIDLDCILPTAARTEISLVDLAQGRSSVLLREYRPAGFQRLQLDVGQKPSGWYLLRLHAGTFDVSRRILLP